MTSTHRYLTACSLLAMLAALVIAIALAGCTSNTASTPQGTGTAPSNSGPGAVMIKSFSFSPSELTVKQGTAVTWTNQDSVIHTVVSDDGAPDAFTSDSLPQGAAFTFTFTKPGTYPYHCSVHPSMKGTIIVTS